MEAQEQLKITMEALRLHDANNKMMSVNETANYLGVHRDTVIRAIENGDIKGQLIGRVWRIPKLQFLEKIIEEN